MKNIIIFVLLACVNTPQLFAQDIHYTQFDATPLAVNPAFTGMFDGGMRASALYRNQWASITVPFFTYGASFDMPVFASRKGDYLAAGMQVFKDQAGDGNLSNFNGIVSVAYHKSFGDSLAVKNQRGCELSVGLQGAYAVKSIDVTKMFYGDDFVDGTFVPGGNGYRYGLGNYESSFSVNAGLCFSQAFGPKFNYIAGVSASNINQPGDAMKRKDYKYLGMGTSYTGVFGANWIVQKRLTLRPAFLVVANEILTAVTAGNEFRYALRGSRVFLGIWYRTGDVATLTGGIECGRIRIGAGYDYQLPALNTAANGSGGFELSVRYIAPGRYSVNKRAIPCTRL